MSDSHKEPIYVQPPLNITVTVVITQGGNILCDSPISLSFVPYRYQGHVVWPYWNIADRAFRRAVDDCIAKFESGYKDDIYLGT